MLDIRLKNNKYFNRISVIFIMIVIVFSLLTISSYTMINKIADNNSYRNTLSESYELKNYLQIYNYVLAYDIHKSNTNEYIEPQTLFGIDSESYEEGFIEKFSTLEFRMKEDLKNLHYFVRDDKTNKTLTNTTGTLKLLNESNINEENMNKIKDYYDFYIKLSFDASGNLTVSDTNSNLIAEIYSMYNLNYNNETPVITENFSGKKLKAITNMTFIYGVPKELSYIDNIYSLKYNSDLYHAVGNTSTPILLTLLGILIFLVLIIPYNKEKELILFKLFQTIYIELKVTIMVLLIFVVVFSKGELILGTVSGRFAILLNQNGLPNGSFVILGLNLICWIPVYTFVALYGIYLKLLVKDSFKESILESSLILIIYRNTIRKAKTVYNKIVLYYSIEEIGGRPYKTLMITILLSFIVVALLCSIWFWGILLAIPFSIFIFYLIKKILQRYIDNYNKLIKLSEEVYQGKFDAKIESDLGILNPIAQNIMKTSEGFKSAVEKEIKSERLKTELISNVSHDLKTPLTSIINYVDLMKTPNLNEDTKEEYLDILDKKSQRLKTLIEDLFEASKAKSGNIILHKEDINIVALIKQTLTELNDKIEASDLVFKSNFSDEKIILNLDGRSTFRIFENIFINATKYAMPGSRVYLEIREDDGFIEIVCKNMSRVEMNFNGEEIVERFSRGDSSRNTEGSGLGLSITKSLVELQNGTFKVTVDGDLFKTEIRFPI